jgi:hypothetical protein
MAIALPPCFPLPSHRDWDVQGLCLGFIYKYLRFQKNIGNPLFFSFFEKNYN